MASGRHRSGDPEVEGAFIAVVAHEDHIPCLCARRGRTELDGESVRGSGCQKEGQAFRYFEARRCGNRDQRC